MNNIEEDSMTSARFGEVIRGEMLNMQMHIQFKNKFFKDKDSNSSIFTPATNNHQLQLQNQLQLNESNQIISNHEHRQNQSIYLNPYNQKEKQIQSKYNPEKNKPYKWKKNALLILSLIKQFIQIIKFQSESYKFRSLIKKQSRFIGDKASNFTYFKYNQKSNKLLVSNQLINFILYRYFKKCYQWFFIIINSVKVIQPNSIYTVIWDVILIFVTVLNLFYIPIELGFTKMNGLYDESNVNLDQVKISDYNEHKHLIINNDWHFALNQIPSWIFLFDLILQFNIAIFEYGEIVYSRTKIVKFYLKKHFFWDIFALMPFLLQNHISSFFNILFLLRMHKVIKIFSNFEDIINLKDKFAALKDLLKLVCMIIYTAHITGCGLFLVAQFEEFNQDQNTWIIKQGLLNEDLITNYINSLYWAVITLITIGYGDITPVTNKEKIYVIFVSFISCGVYAYAINNVGQIIQEMSKRSKQFKIQMSSLTSHMKKRGLSQSLQLKVKKYFEYINKEKLEDNEEGEALLNQLNQSLKNDVKQEIFGKILQRYKLFYLNFSNQFLQALAPKLKEKRFTPEEIIYQEQAQSQRRIYFLMKGKVNITLNILNSKKQYSVINSIQDSGIFGEYRFITGNPNLTGAISSNVVSVVILEFEDFINLIKCFPLDYEKFCQLKDSICFYNITMGTGIRCYSCESYRHSLLQCSQITFKPNKYKMIYQSTQSELQLRNELYNRNQRKTESPLGYIDILRETVIQYLINNNPFDNLQQLLDLLEDIKHQSILEMNFDQHESKQVKLQQQQQQEKQQLQTKSGSQSSLTFIQEVNINSEQIQKNSSQSSLQELLSSKGSSEYGSNKNKVIRNSLEINEEMKKLVIMQQLNDNRRCSISNLGNRRGSLFKQNTPEQRRSQNMFDDVLKQIEYNQRNSINQIQQNTQQKVINTENISLNDIKDQNQQLQLLEKGLGSSQQENNLEVNSQNKIDNEQQFINIMQSPNLKKIINNNNVNYNQPEFKKVNQKNYSDRQSNTTSNMIDLSENFCFVAKFDKLFNFSIYFPKNNINYILKVEKSSLIKECSQNYSSKSKKQKLLTLMEQSKCNLNKKNTKIKLFSQKQCYTENLINQE